jgi:CheY-like chemotaxis protein
LSVLVVGRRFIDFMKSALHILLLEDSTLDACLIERELRGASIPFRLTMIENESQLRRELSIDHPDLVLSDHNVPSFDGFTALKIVREQFPRLPFIFVSGSNDQQMILEMYERGATDYVFKRDINDLKQAVKRALDPHQEDPPAENPPVNDDSAKYDPSLAFGHLVFCPECLHAWDENGQRVPMGKYLGSHAETFVIRQNCMKCGKPKPAH